MVLINERRELARPDATISYWVSGPADDHHAWDAQVAALGERYRVVVPDLRGHGGSTTAGRFRFEDALADVLALLDVLDAERPGYKGPETPAGAPSARPSISAPSPITLGGLSLGGNLAQEVVYRDPDRVDALVVADATCNTSVRHPLATLHADRDYRLPVPTLLLHGDADRVGDVVEATRAWAARDDRAEYVVVPGAGHASNQDNPAAFSAALLAFLDRVHGPVAAAA